MIGRRFPGLLSVMEPDGNSGCGKLAQDVSFGTLGYRTHRAEVTVATAGGQSASKSKPWAGVYDIAAFVIPACSWCELSLIGRLLLSDVLLMAAFPFLVASVRKRLRQRTLCILSALMLLWLANQIVTDMIRGTAFEDLARGWAKIALLIVNLMTLSAILANHRKRFVLYAVGVAVGALTATWLNPNQMFLIDKWKFGYCRPVNLAVALLATLLWSRGLRIQALFLMLVGSYVNIVLGYRAMAGVMFVGACLLLVRASRSARKLLSPMRIVWLLAFLGGLGFTFIKSVEVTAKQGWFGDALRVKVEEQTSGDLGLLVGGRGLALAGLIAIANSPFIGIGSWQDGGEYVMEMGKQLQEYGYSFSEQSIMADSRATSHSHILGAWVEAGIWGAIFWAAVTGLVARQLLAVPWRDEPVAPLIVLIGFQLVWDVFFSPFAQEQRFLAPYYILLVLTAKSFPRFQEHGIGSHRSPARHEVAAPGQPL
jgi:hypothetical protein